MLTRALLILLVATMATMPSLANACALDCAASQSGLSGTAAQDAAGMHCHDEAPATEQPPDDGNSPDSGMASLCAFAAAGAISISPDAVSLKVPVIAAAYFPPPTASQIPALPDEPPRT